MNESLLNSTLQNYVNGTITNNDLITYFAQHYFLLPILMIVIIPAICVIGSRIIGGKMSRNAFWMTYIFSLIVAVILAILTFVGFLPLNLAI